MFSFAISCLSVLRMNSLLSLLFLPLLFFQQKFKIIGTINSNVIGTFTVNKNIRTVIDTTIADTTSGTKEISPESILIPTEIYIFRLFCLSARKSRYFIPTFSFFFINSRSLTAHFAVKLLSFCSTSLIYKNRAKPILCPALTIKIFTMLLHVNNMKMFFRHGSP